MDRPNCWAAYRRGVRPRRTRVPGPRPVCESYPRRKWHERPEWHR
ncbi:hypothetical protein DFR74_101785 [Nocardia puris]|uniref:Uncharacterized protein n=1 Tax=Nocardia puris TaxID=208602 RepID=A0A366E5T6_9NOCA|nr:hypothetical protein DFR74_101785 [Nocardia puris]